MFYQFITTRPQDAYMADVYKTDLGRDFDRGLTRALRFAARPESMRYNLAAVRIDAANRRMIATDGCRLVVAHLRDTQDLPTVSLDVVSLLRAREEADKGGLQEAHVTPWGLAFDVIHTFVGLASDQKFPDVDNVIPKTEPSIRVEGGALLKACKRLRKLADRADAAITMRVNVEAGELSLEIQATQTKSKQAETVKVPCAVLKALAKRQERIGIDLKYLADAVIDTERSLSLGWDDDLSPIKISEEGTDDFAVVMPMRL